MEINKKWGDGYRNQAEFLHWGLCGDQQKMGRWFSIEDLFCFG